MKTKPTIKNHFIPCFWSAFWNIDYLEGYRKTNGILELPRKILLNAYHRKSKLPFPKKAEELFYYKKAYLSIIENEADYLELLKVFPKILKDFEDFDKEYLNIFDSENSFTAYENIFKPSLFNVIKECKVSGLEDKIYLSFFIYIQIIRSPYYFNLFKDLFNFAPKGGLYLFIEIQKSITDEYFLYKSLEFLFSKSWNIYVSKDYCLPISDLPLFEEDNVLYICLAPDLLLEIKINEESMNVNNYCVMSEELKDKVVHQISKSFKEHIVFADLSSFDSLL